MGLRKDAAVSLLGFALMLAVAFLYNWPEPRVQNLKFGWEYGNTAASLASGQGYANPFEGVRSGPTAWMPPAYVGLMASVFALLGVKTPQSLWALLALKYAGIATALFLLLRAIDGAERRGPRWLLVVAFAVPLLANRATVFWSLHDTWVVLLASSLVLHNFALRRRKPSLRSDAVLLGLALVLPLTSPALAASFAALLLCEAAGAWRRGGGSRGGSRGVTRFALAFAILAIASGAWGIRNQLALNTFVPVKSNLWFDFYQANQLDDDGLVTNATFLAYNPSNPNRYQERFAAMGEGRFTREYRRLATRRLQTAPGEVARRISRRARSAFLYLHDPDDVRSVDSGLLADGDLRELLGAGLLGSDWRGETVWLSLGLSPQEFAARIGSLRLERADDVRRSWRDARSRVASDTSHWSIVGRSLILSTLPTLCVVFGFLHGPTRREPLFGAAVVLYLGTLLPYVLVSHYLRYQVSLLGLQSVFSFQVGATGLALAIGSPGRSRRPGLR